MNVKRSLLPIITYVPIDVKRLFRDKVAIFFVFLFPLIFLGIFGSIFGGDNDVSFRVALLNNSDSEFASKFAAQLKDNKLFKIDEKTLSIDKGKEKMSRSQLDAIIVLPVGFGNVSEGNSYPSGQAEVVYSQTNQTAGQALGSILEGAFKEINSQLAPAVTPFTVKTESSTIAGLKQFDYTFSGVLGFALLSLGIFGPTSVFPRLKQRGVLRRYNTTTIRVWQYFVANVLSNAFVGLLSTALMFVAALTLFDLNMRGNYFNMAVVIVLGVIMLFGIGLAIGGWAKNENQAAPLAQIATIPMMFLSGVFFPTFVMPEVLQKVTIYVPLTPVVDSIRLILTENASLIDLGPQLAVMMGWTLAVYLLAFKIFRWE